MGRETGISWCHHTANFWVGCQRVSPGCGDARGGGCYAETLVTNRMGLRVWGPPSTTERQRTKAAWTDVPRWNRDAAKAGERRRLFVSSLADVFEDHLQVAPWRAEALALLETCTALDVLLLTKRPQNILSMVPSAWLADWPRHVWVGATVEDQRRADERIPALLRVPAAVRFLSCEPLLEAVDLFGDEETPGPAIVREGVRYATDYGTGEEWDENRYPGISWVIVGGESGHSARPLDLAWARSIVRQCADAAVPVFVKQLGARPTYMVSGIPFVFECIRDRAGADPSEWPSDLRVQQFPEVTP